MTAPKAEYHAYLSSPAFGAMSYQQWLAAKAFIEGDMTVEQAIELHRGMKQ